jgi:hypothetical protein
VTGTQRSWKSDSIQSRQVRLSVSVLVTEIEFIVFVIHFVRNVRGGGVAVKLAFCGITKGRL